MIYAIVMAGGRGTRLKVDVEKPLFKLHGKPLIKYVLDNISSSKLVEDVVIAVSSHTQETTKYLESLNGNFQILDTSGIDYLNDFGIIDVPKLMLQRIDIFYIPVSKISELFSHYEKDSIIKALDYDASIFDEMK